MLIADPAQSLKPLLAKMIIPALALDGFDDDCRNVRTFLCDDAPDLGLGNPLLLRHGEAARRFRQRKINERCAYARPRKLGEVSGLFGVRVGQA